MHTASFSLPFLLAPSITQQQAVVFLLFPVCKLQRPHESRVGCDDSVSSLRYSPLHRPDRSLCLHSVFLSCIFDSVRTDSKCRLGFHVSSGGILQCPIPTKFCSIRLSVSTLVGESNRSILPSADKLAPFGVKSLRCSQFAGAAGDRDLT